MTNKAFLTQFLPVFLLNVFVWMMFFIFILGWGSEVKSWFIAIFAGGSFGALYVIANNENDKQQRG